MMNYYQKMVQTQDLVIEMLNDLSPETVTNIFL